MTAIRTLVVDDEPLARQTISTLLETDPDIIVTGECASGTEAIEVIKTRRPDLVFLDVQMPGCDGFEVIERLGTEAPKGIVFVTAYDRYALKAFEVEALDYLLKPFTDDRFFRVLARAKASLESQNPEPRLVVKSAGRVTFLRTADIDWIEAADYYACLHVGGRSHLIRRSMADLERELDAKIFCRIHRSAIVNVNRIQELRLDSNGDYEAVLKDHKEIKVSRPCREHLQEMLNVCQKPAPVSRKP